MTQWILDHWHALTGWSVTTIFVAIWTWISAHHGQLRKLFRWIWKQYHLRTENETLTAQLAEAQQRAIRAEKCAADSEVRNKQADAEIGILKKQLEPPDIQLPEIKIIRLLAVRGYGISRGGLRTQAALDRTRGDYHINRLEQTFNFIHVRCFADGRAPIYELTDKGKAYAVTNDLDKTQSDHPDGVAPVNAPTPKCSTAV